jgi:UDP-glucose 4-epimerase
MKVLVVGGCGFIGSHLIDELIEHGASVSVLDLKPERFRTPLAGVQYIQGAISNISLLRKALSGIDAVIHLASSTVPATSNLDPARDLDDNLIGMVRMLELMREVGVGKIIYLSSGGTVYGLPEADFIEETHPNNPLSSYGIVKLAAEKYLHMYHKLYGIEYVALRASNPYGPRQGNTGIQGIIGTFLWKTATGQALEIWGDGSVVRDYIHIRDLVTLCLQSLKLHHCGVFNAGSGQGTSVNEIVQLISQVTGKNLTPNYQPSRSYDVPYSVLSIKRAAQLLHWQPKISLVAGIEETWDWINKQQL